MTVTSLLFTSFLSLNLFIGKITQILIFFLLSNDCIYVALGWDVSDELRQCFSTGADFLHTSSPTRGHLVRSLTCFWLSKIGEGATDNQWIKVTVAVKYPTMHKNKTADHSPKQRSIWSQMSVVPRLRNTELRYHDFLAFLGKAPDSLCCAS